MLDWIVGSGVKDENINLKNQVKLIELELELKIKENMDLHNQLFEMKYEFTINQQKLEKAIETNKLILEDKTTQLNKLTEQNISLGKIKSDLDLNYKSQISKYIELDSKYNNKKNKWKHEKAKFQTHSNLKETLIHNLLPFNEYNSYDFNILNNNQIISCLGEYAYNNNNISVGINNDNRGLNIESKSIFMQQLQVINKIISLLVENLIPVDTLLEFFIERVNILHANVEHKSEHRAYLLCYEKVI